MAREELVWSEYVHEGKMINVRVDTVRIDAGPLKQREVVEHPGAVAILPVRDDGQIVLIRQYRHAVGRFLLEVPAGTREPPETALECAERELAEETGYRAKTITELTRFYVTPGWCNEELICYLASGLTEGDKSLEDDETIETVIIHPNEVDQLVAQGDIGDAKTMMSILQWKSVAS